MVEQGSCPKCGEFIQDYEALEIHSNLIAYPFTCEKCGFCGLEWYATEFNGFTDRVGQDIN